MINLHQNNDEGKSIAEFLTEDNKTSNYRMSINGFIGKIFNNRQLVNAANKALNGNIYTLVKLTGKSRSTIESIIRKIKSILL